MPFRPHLPVLGSLLVMSLVGCTSETTDPATPSGASGASSASAGAAGSAGTAGTTSGTSGNAGLAGTAGAAGSAHAGTAGDGGAGSAGDAGTGGNAGSAGNAGNAGNAGDGGQAGDSGSSGAAGATVDTVVRVHYPAGSSVLSIRGSGGGLSWTEGMPLSASGDTWSITLSGVSSPIEWKPLQDDTTWSRGPNYRVSPGETIDVYPHFTTAQGSVTTLLSAFHSTVLNNDRAIYAYLPPSYAENTGATYPVVYMHDGQNLWAALPDLAFGATWNVDTAFDQAAENGACSSSDIEGWGAQQLGGAPLTCTGDGDCDSGACRTFPEAIVIGIANNADRIHEYTPTTDPDTAGGGGADLYLKMIVTELKPTIDGMLRTRPDVRSTTISGSSLGGLVSVYGALKYPSVFGEVAALSPSAWWNNDVIVTDIAATLPAPMRPSIVYVDSGQGSADGQADTDMLAAAYLGLGYVDGVNFRHVVQSGASHNEVYWAQRFPGAMQLVLGVR